MIKLKRIYEAASPKDGKRIYVDRLWPRGLKKEDAKMDAWLKDLAPSTELRKWYGHDPSRYDEFKRRYIRELASKSQIIERIREEGRTQVVTLLFSAKDTEHNNAVVLKEIMRSDLDM